MGQFSGGEDRSYFAIMIIGRIPSPWIVPTHRFCKKTQSTTRYSKKSAASERDFHVSPTAGCQCQQKPKVYLLIQHVSSRSSGLTYLSQHFANTQGAPTSSASFRKFTKTSKKLSSFVTRWTRFSKSTRDLFCRPIQPKSNRTSESHSLDSGKGQKEPNIDGRPRSFPPNHTKDQCLVSATPAPLMNFEERYAQEVSRYA